MQLRARVRLQRGLHQQARVLRVLATTVSLRVIYFVIDLSFYVFHLFVRAIFQTIYLSFDSMKYLNHVVI